MKAKPNINDFLDGGEISQIEKNNKFVKVHRELKIFRLPTDLINALKRRAFEESAKTGERITETFMVGEALRKHLMRIG